MCPRNRPFVFALAALVAGIVMALILPFWFIVFTVVLLLVFSSLILFGNFL